MDTAGKNAKKIQEYLFVAFESLACKSVVKPSDARTAVDLAHSLREL